MGWSRGRHQGLESGIKMSEIQNNASFYAILMLIAGIGIPIMAALNAGLGEKLQSPALAATILFFVGMIASYFIFNNNTLSWKNHDFLFRKYISVKENFE